MKVQKEDDDCEDNAPNVVSDEREQGQKQEQPTQDEPPSNRTNKALKRKAT